MRMYVLLTLLFWALVAVAGMDVSAGTSHDESQQPASSNLPPSLTIPILTSTQEPPPTTTSPSSTSTPGPPGARLFIPVTDSRLQLRGRWVKSNRLGFAHYYPDSMALLHFTGSSFVALHLANEKRPEIFYRVVNLGIGGTRSSSPQFGAWRYVDLWANLVDDKLVTGLNTNTTYVVQILFRMPQSTELSVVPVILLRGFSLAKNAKTMLMPCPAPTKPTIEFVGDSITAGVFDAAKSPNLGSYAFEACRLLGARCSVVAKPSVRLVGGMDSAYFSAQPWEGPKIPWNIASQNYQPDIIAINLGSNDRHKWIDEFVSAFTKFIGKLRQAYGNKTKIVVIQPFGKVLLGTTKYTFQPQYELSTWKRIIKEANDPNVVLLETTGWITPQTAHWLRDGLHPTAEGGLMLGAKVADALKRIQAAPKAGYGRWEPLCAA